ncbi:hypothetical protein SLJ62_02185 [Acinetobacter pittii]|uniref:hypothetical protein n=1 Tax=Acinetobacter pittii TaxID=48296 RepID=UPI00238057BF|nr:hypothetical protein [Acinetobacter pittii]MDE4040748.1 hypothetical protein [Acinetobacter pittii]MDX8154356.1 hypothetical protein [Acinetobacter pittii]
MGMTLKELNKQIDDFKSSGKDPKKLVIGYKTFAVLMENDKFLDKIEKDKDDPMVRYYKGIKIKMVTEKHHLEIE